MKKTNDTQIGLAVIAIGVAFLAFVIAGTKTERQVLSDADHPIDRQSLIAALKKARAKSGPHPLPQLFTPATSQPGRLPRDQMKEAGGLDPASRMPPSGRGPVAARAKPKPMAVGEVPMSQRDASLLGVQEKLSQAMAAIDKARSELRTAVAFRSQPTSRG